MIDRYERAREVSVPQIAVEMGWGLSNTRHWLNNHRPWVFRMRKKNGRYDAHVIDVMRKLYGQAPQQPRDFLADYIKEI